MRFPDLAAWLAWQETLHPSEIELGLERVAAVLARMGLSRPDFAVITVGGTNGKGSTVAMLDAILRAGGYRVGAYTSPHLLRYNERIRIDGVPIEDEALCAAFERVDVARAETSLTYFEFGTLAAIVLFQSQEVEVAILEVGMGGRLDAVNVLEPDVAIVTTVDLDHAQWLGNTREAIGFEKAGIYRCAKPAIFGSVDAPQTLLDHGHRIGAQLLQFGRDFGYRAEDGGWRWWGPERARTALPLPALRGRSQLQNAAGVLMVLECLAERLPLSQAQIRQGLLEVSLPGRFQIQSGPVTRILDVAHNPQAAEELAANLATMPCSGRTLAVVGMLADKDMTAVLSALAAQVDHWFLGGLAVPRGASSVQLQQAVSAAGIETGRVSGCTTVRDALTAAQQAALSGDRVVIFGSFYTVAEALTGSV